MLVPGERAANPTLVLISAGALRARVIELGQAIARDYAKANPVLVGVLEGARVFMADLVGAISIPCTTDTIGVSSYGDTTRSAGRVTVTGNLASSIAGRHVVIVDDIIDTGRTLVTVKQKLEADRPRSVRSCVLLNKIERREIDVVVDYVGFSIPNIYVVGYGLDYAGRYRNLPYIAALSTVANPAGPGGS